MATTENANDRDPARRVVRLRVVERPPVVESVPLPLAAVPASEPTADVTLPAGESKAEDTDRGRFRKVIRSKAAWVLAAFVTAALSQAVADSFHPAVKGVTSAARWVLGMEAPLTAAEQMDRTAGKARAKGYTIKSSSVQFNYGPKVELMVLSPASPATATDSAQLRVYSVPEKGDVKLMWEFKPQLTRSPSADRQIMAPETLGIRVRSADSFNGTPGTQVLIDVYDAALPSLIVAPLLLSRSMTDGKFTLAPLLSPSSIRNSSMSGLLSKKYLNRGNWANLARTVLYERPLAIRDAAHPKTVMRAYAASGYAISTATPYGTNGGVLTLAAGYTVRGGTLPSPAVMQVLVWRINLTSNTPSATTFSDIPTLVSFPDSVSETDVQRSLRRATRGLPPQPNPVP